MQLKIKQINIKNVKGITEVSLPITDKFNLSGANGIGKSTLLDTVMWVLTGQSDLQNRKFDPTVTGLATDNETLAELIITVDGEQHSLKLTKKSQTSGVSYYIDGEKVKKAEYTLAINNMGIKNIELLANPFYLIDTLTWQEARKVVSDLIVQPSEESVDNALLTMNIQPQTIEYGKSIKWNIQTLRDDHIATVAKLDILKANLRHEQSKLTDLPDEADTLLLETQKIQLTNQRVALENGDLIKELNDEMVRLSGLIEKSKVSTTKITNKKLALETAANNLAATHDTLTREYTAKLEEGKTVASQSVVGTCGTCGQDLNEHTVGQMRETIKIKSDEIMVAANAIKQQMDKAKTDYSKATLELNTYKAANLDVITAGAKLQQMYNDEYQAAFQKRGVAMNTDQLAEIDVKLADINKKLATESKFIKESIVNLEKQIAEITSHLDKLISGKDAISKRLSIIATDVKSQLTSIFPGLEIILEKHMKNGDVKPDFTVSINGVVYKDLNTAGKFKAATIIALGLQNLLDLQVPIIVDNVEGISALTWGETVPSTQDFISAEVVK